MVLFISHKLTPIYVGAAVETARLSQREGGFTYLFFFGVRADKAHIYLSWL